MKAYDPIKSPVLPARPEVLETLDVSDGETLELEQVRLVQVELTSARIKYAYLSNVVLEDCLFFGSHLGNGRIIRTEIKRGIYSGVIMSGASFEDVQISGAKFNMANFRTTTFKRVRFVDCDLSEADFGGARFDQVVFSGCRLDGAEFSDCAIVAADMRGSDLSLIKGIGGLRRATISSTQLMQLSGVMAAEFGLRIEG